MVIVIAEFGGKQSHEIGPWCHQHNNIGCTIWGVNGPVWKGALCNLGDGVFTMMFACILTTQMVSIAKWWACGVWWNVSKEYVSYLMLLCYLGNFNIICFLVMNYMYSIEISVTRVQHVLSLITIETFHNKTKINIWHYNINLLLIYMTLCSLVLHKL